MGPFGCVRIIHREHQLSYCGGFLHWYLVVSVPYNIRRILGSTITSWCVYYDTLYAMMDKKDDVRVGIKSTAILFGSSARPILAGFSLCFVAALCVCGVNIGASTPYFIFAVGAPGLYFAWQLFTVDFESNASCLKMFSGNSTQLGYLIYFGLVSEYLLRL